MKTELIQLGNPRDTHGARLVNGVVLHRYKSKYSGTMAYLAVPFDGTLWCAHAWECRHGAPDFGAAKFYSTNVQTPIYVNTSFGDEIGKLFENFCQTPEAKELDKMEPEEVKNGRRERVFDYYEDTPEGILENYAV